MAIRVNGQDMKDAVIKADQFEMKILDLTPDHLKASIRDTSGQPFNFVPRFMSMVYPDKTIDAKDSGVIVVRSRSTIETVIQFRERLRIESFLTMELRYARRKLASIVVE
jgi:hypothetical protein